MCYFKFTRILRRVNEVFLPISFILIGRLLIFFFFGGGGVATLPLMGVSWEERGGHEKGRERRD